MMSSPSITYKGFVISLESTKEEVTTTSSISCANIKFAITLIDNSENKKRFIKNSYKKINIKFSIYFLGGALDKLEVLKDETNLDRRFVFKMTL